jgi:hypothetical protein
MGGISRAEIAGVALLPDELLLRKGRRTMEPTSEALPQSVCEPALNPLTEAALHGITRALASMTTAIVGNWHFAISRNC